MLPKLVFLIGVLSFVLNTGSEPALVSCTVLLGIWEEYAEFWINSMSVWLNCVSPHFLNKIVVSHRFYVAHHITHSSWNILLNRWLSSCISCGWGLCRQPQSWGCSGWRLVRRAWPAWWSSCSWCPCRPCLEGFFLSSGKTHFWNESLCFLDADSFYFISCSSSTLREQSMMTLIIWTVCPRQMMILNPCHCQNCFYYCCKDLRN